MISVQDCTAVINQLLPEPHAGLLSGIVFGTKAQLTAEFKDALITTGTIHITALSGMNITIIANLAVRILLKVFSKRIASLLSILCVIGFVLFVGTSPSVVRAAIMGCLSLVAVAFGRQQRGLYLLGVTVVLMILYRFSYLGELSFQLSVLSTFGILVFSKKRLLKQSKYIPSFIYDDLQTTLSAQVFTTPLIAVSFHRVSLIAPVANILIGVLIPPLTVFGMILVGVGMVFPFLAIPLSWFLWMILQYFVWVIEILAQFPFASIEW